MKVEIEIEEKDIPAGYRFVAIRSPKKDDLYVSGSGEVLRALSNHDCHAKLIVKKIKKWIRLELDKINLNNRYLGIFTDNSLFNPNQEPDLWNGDAVLFAVAVSSMRPFIDLKGGSRKHFWILEE